MHKSTYRDPIFHGEPAQRLPSFSHKKHTHTVRSLKVNETKLTLRNVFVLDPFALGGQTESKYNERTPFWGSMQKPLAFERRIYASFRIILVLGIFWRLPLTFRY